MSDLRARLDRLSRLPGERRDPAPLPPSLADRLARLRTRSAEINARRPTDGELAQRLGGTVLAPALLAIERSFPLPFAHGATRVAGAGELAEGARRSLRDDAERDAEGMLFLDTETSGLAGGTGTTAFVLGLASVRDDVLTVRQLLMTGFAGERPLLEQLVAALRARDCLVTFNGKSFDLPLLRARTRLAGIEWPDEPLAAPRPPARHAPPPARRLARLPSAHRRGARARLRAHRRPSRRGRAGRVAALAAARRRRARCRASWTTIARTCSRSRGCSRCWRIRRRARRRCCVRDAAPRPRRRFRRNGHAPSERAQRGRGHRPRRAVPRRNGARTAHRENLRAGPRRHPATRTGVWRPARVRASSLRRRERAARDDGRDHCACRSASRARSASAERRRGVGAGVDPPSARRARAAPPGAGCGRTMASRDQVVGSPAVARYPACPRGPGSRGASGIGRRTRLDLAGDASDATGDIRPAVPAKFRLDLECSGCICQAFMVSTTTSASQARTR